MKIATAAPSTRPGAKLNTEEFAERVRVKPQSIRAALCRTGFYLGIKPVKLSTGKLLWDADAVERLTAGERA